MRVAAMVTCQPRRLASRATRPDPEVSGISLRLIVGLAATALGSVHAPPERLDATVDSTLPLRRALMRAGAGTQARAGATGPLPRAGRRHLPRPRRVPRDRPRRGRHTREPDGPDAAVEALLAAGAVGIVLSGRDRAAYRRALGGRHAQRPAAHRGAARPPRHLHDRGAERHPRAPDGDAAPPRGRRPRPRADRARGRLARRPLRAGRRLPRRGRHGDDDRRARHRPRRVEP